MLIADTNGLRVKFSVKGSAPNAGWHIGKAVPHQESPQTPADYLPDWNTPSYGGKYVEMSKKTWLWKYFCIYSAFKFRLQLLLLQSRKRQSEFQNTEL